MDVVVDSAKLWLSEFLPYWRKAEGTLAVVGLCYAGSVAASLLWQVTNGVRVHFWSRLWKKDLVGKYGKWAGTYLKRFFSFFFSFILYFLYPTLLCH